MEGLVFFYSFCVDFFYLPCMAFTTDGKLSQFVVSPQTSMSGLFFFSLLALQCHLALITFVLVFSQSSLHASVDHELVSRMKSLELENQTLHKGIFLIVFFLAIWLGSKITLIFLSVVEDMRAALLKLETRVAVLEKTPTPVAVPCAKVFFFMY